MKKKIFDLFCGTGGFSKGFENASNHKYEVIFGIDLLPVAIETFKANHPTSLAIAGDIRKQSCEVLADQLNLKKGELDLIIGGPPCQGFSSIRPFRSTNDDDPRNSLFEEFARFVNYFRPKKFILENVVGLATHKNGQTINQIIDTFSGIGYKCDWRIVNASHYGVPQRRERFILIGTADGAEIRFPKPTHFNTESTIGYRDKNYMVGHEAPLFEMETIKLQPAVTVLDAIGDLPQIQAGECADEYTKNPITQYQKDRRRNGKKLELHCSTKHSSKMLEIIKHSGPNIYSIPKGLIKSGFSSCYSRLDGDKSSVTITVNFVHPASNRCIHPVLDRALTPREGARIQSFDDDFVFKGSKTQIVKQIGNAVPPLLGQKLAECLWD